MPLGRPDRDGTLALLKVENCQEEITRSFDIAHPHRDVIHIHNGYPAIGGLMRAKPSCRLYGKYG